LASPSSPFSTHGDRVRVSVRVTPKASRTGISGVEVDAEGNAYLKVRVTTPPEKGKANGAVIKLLAKQWGLAPRDLTVVTGDTARNKILEISGGATTLLRILNEWLKQQKTGAR